MFTYKRCIYPAVLAAVFSLAATAQNPAILPLGTVNAADYSRDFAPGAIISIFGTNLATGLGGPTVVPLPTTLNGTTVELVNGSTVTPLPLFYISATQVNAELPYGIPLGSAQIRVRTAGGTTAVDTINVVARAPKMFTANFSGKGTAIVTDTKYNIVTQGQSQCCGPVTPGDYYILWVNGLGETTPAVTAGSPAAGGAIVSGVGVTIGGKPATVTFAGAAPGFSGLYQINIQAPFIVVTGPQDIQVTVGGATTQAAVTVPYQQLGFYKALLGGKSVTGQSITGAAALAYRQTDQVAWGTPGFNAWVHPPAAAPVDSTVAGEAVTLRNGSATVYDNNGIEDGTGASFYNNAGGGPDNVRPGLANLESMSNYFPLIFSGYIRLAQSTPVTEMIGYFDGDGDEATAPWDPENPYVKYRMNIWSNAGGMPKETGGYVGDVFSTDTTAGKFTVSATNVTRVSSNTSLAPDPIWRVSFKPNSAVTLPAGEYWFSHDASVRGAPSGGTSTSSAWITTEELAEIMRMQPQSGEKVRFSFFGREMVYQESWILPFAVEVRPSAPITTDGFKSGKNTQ